MIMSSENSAKAEIKDERCVVNSLSPSHESSKEMASRESSESVRATHRQITQNHLHQELEIETKYFIMEVVNTSLVGLVPGHTVILIIGQSNVSIILPNEWQFTHLFDGAFEVTVKDEEGTMTIKKNEKIVSIKPAEQRMFNGISQHLQIASLRCSELSSSH